MIDQLKIRDKQSYDEFEASVRERVINAPKKKSVKETVPFSNVSYDFSAINGEVYWEERTLEYVFEITANTPEELEEKKQKFASWIMNVMNDELHDPFIRDYHFVATFDDFAADDSEIEKSTITVKFTAYPYMIADAETLYAFDLIANDEVEAVLSNKSSHRITPTFKADVPVSVTMDGISYAIGAGKTTDETFKLPVGDTTVKIRATSENGTLSIGFFEEVF